MLDPPYGSFLPGTTCAFGSYNSQCFDVSQNPVPHHEDQNPFFLKSGRRKLRPGEEKHVVDRLFKSETMTYTFQKMRLKNRIAAKERRSNLGRWKPTLDRARATMLQSHKANARVPKGF